MPMRNINFEMPRWIYLPAILLIAGGLKIWLVYSGMVPFNADEAVVALMARHTLQGEMPIFFYGQAYMGSLDAWLVAAGFALAGESIEVMRIVQSLLYLGVIVTTIHLGNEAFQDGRIGWLAGLLLAVPTVNVSLYTTASLGGYGETLLIGNLILLVGLRLEKCLANQPSEKLWMWLSFGLLCGFGFWAFGLILVYILPCGAILSRSLLHHRQGKYFWLPILVVFLGLLIGTTPMWIYAIQNGFTDLASELFGSAIAGVEGLGWLAQIWQHLVSLVLLGSSVIFGLRPPWSVTWLGLPLLPFVLIFVAAALGLSIKKLLARGTEFRPRLIIHGIAWCLLAGFIFSPYGADPSGRYFLPLSIPLAFFSAEVIIEISRKYRWIAVGMGTLLLIYNLWGHLQSTSQYPPGLTTQFNAVTQIDNRHYDELLDFLKAKNEIRGYTNYWVSYPLAFLSQEELVYVPRLPYHLDFRYTPRDDRYPPYRQELEQAYRVAYITTHHPDLDRYLRAQFLAHGVAWDEKTIGDFQVFYNLSTVIHPEQIGLGEQKP